MELEHPRNPLFSKGRNIVFGLVLSVLVLVGAGLVVHFLPGSSKTANVAHASGGGGGGCFTTTGPVCTFRDQFVSADFQTVSADGCTVADAFVFAANNVSRPNPAGSGPFANMDLFVVNQCTGMTVASAFGGTSAIALQVSNTLASGTLSGTFPLFDFCSQTTTNFTVNLKWLGIGQTMSFIDVTHVRSGNTVFISHNDSDNRAALASGTISDGTTNFASSPTLNANIGTSRGGTLQITHQGAAGSSSTPFSGGGGGC